MHFQSIQRQCSSKGYNTFEYTTVCSIFDKGYRYGFNGKEKDNEINVGGGNYDYGGRIYDGRLGRWLSLDPLQAMYPSISPYVFCSNSPLSFIDVGGKNYTYKLQRGSQPNTRILTISAVYNCVKGTESEIQKGIDAWGKLSGSKVTIDGVEFTVNFELTVKVHNTLEEAQTVYNNSNLDGQNGYLSNKNEDGTTNLTDLRDLKTFSINEKPNIVLGETIDGNMISIPIMKYKAFNRLGLEEDLVVNDKNSASTQAHEIGHTLGLDHSVGKTCMSSEDDLPGDGDIINLVKTFLNPALKKVGVTGTESNGTVCGPTNQLCNDEGKPLSLTPNNTSGVTPPPNSSSTTPATPPPTSP